MPATIYNFAALMQPNVESTPV